jgi:hypothetical protein
MIYLGCILTVGPSHAQERLGKSAQMRCVFGYISKQKLELALLVNDASSISCFHVAQSSLRVTQATTRDPGRIYDGRAKVLVHLGSCDVFQVECDRVIYFSGRYIARHGRFEMTSPHHNITTVGSQATKGEIRKFDNRKPGKTWGIHGNEGKRKCFCTMVTSGKQTVLDFSARKPH